MKKLFLFVVLLMSANIAMAGNNHTNKNHTGHNKHRHHGYVAPLIIGGAVGYWAGRRYYSSEDYHYENRYYDNSYDPRYDYRYDYRYDPRYDYRYENWYNTYPAEVTIQPLHKHKDKHCTRYVYQDRHGNITREEIRCN